MAGQHFCPICMENSLCYGGFCRSWRCGSCRSVIPDRVYFDYLVRSMRNLECERARRTATQGEEKRRDT